MEGTRGQKKIQETHFENPYIFRNKIGVGLPARVYSDVEYNEAVFSPRPILFEKQHYDVFTNPAAKPILSKFKQAVVYGVAANVCVNFAVKGLLDRGKEVWVISDAIKGLPNIGSPINDWIESGAKIKTLNDLKNQVYFVFKQGNIMGGYDLVEREVNDIERDLES